MTIQVGQKVEFTAPNKDALTAIRVAEKAYLIHPREGAEWFFIEDRGQAGLTKVVQRAEDYDCKVENITGIVDTALLAHRTLECALKADGYELWSVDEHGHLWIVSASEADDNLYVYNQWGVDEYNEYGILLASTEATMERVMVCPSWQVRTQSMGSYRTVAKVNMW